jgi:hypothetical protein
MALPASNLYPSASLYPGTSAAGHVNLTDSAQRLYDAVAPLMNSSQPGMSDADNGYVGAILCGALATIGLDDAAYLARDGIHTDSQGRVLPPFAVLFDVDNVDPKWLPWLSQFVGDATAVRSAVFPVVTNLVQNPSFEYDSVGVAPLHWSDTAGTGSPTLTVTNNWAAAGSHSLRYTWTNPDGTSVFAGAQSDRVPAVPGQRYFLSCAYKALNLTNPYLTMSVIWFDSGGGYVDGASVASVTANPGDEGVISGVTAAAPANTAFAHIQVGGGSSTTGDEFDFYLDACMISPSTTAVDFFDGDSAGHQWSGTPGDSSSSTVPGTTDVATQRALIKNPIQLNRGRPAAIKAKAQLRLTGTKTVLFNLRTGNNPWTLTVATYTSETPDPAATKQDILSVMPAWLVPTIETVTGGDYSTLAASHSTYTEMEAAHTSYADIPTTPAA